MAENVKSKCRRCGKEVPVGDFVLDPFYKMMVCDKCFKEREAKSGMAKGAKTETANIIIPEKQIKTDKKSIAKDSDDDYLERAYKRKENELVKVKKLDEERVRYRCPKCWNEFNYNTVKKTPTSCPMCDYKLTNKIKII